MKSFNLEEAKAGKPVCQRDGRPVRILAFDINSTHPIAVAGPSSNPDNGNEEYVICYPNSGHFIKNDNGEKPHPRDLMMAARTVTRWIVCKLGHSGCTKTSVYVNESEAEYTAHIDAASGFFQDVQIVRVDYEV